MALDVKGKVGLVASAAGSDDLFFGALVQSYVDKNPRFLRRDWLATKLDEKLKEPGRRFVLLTAEPGAGKSAFMAQLAHDHPDWLRYFIRRNQWEVLADVSDKSLLLRIGYQLAARRPELFSQEQLRVSVSQRIGQVSDGGEAVGAEVKRLTASPFYQKILEIEQEVKSNQGKAIGLRVEELVIETRLLPAEDLLHLALIDPAWALSRINPKAQIVILIDALDEIRYHNTSENILTWLTNCPDLPDNIRLVLTSRPPDEALKLFCEKQVSRLTQLTIAEDDPSVHADIKQFVQKWTAEPSVAQAINQAGNTLETFAQKATDKARGNLGYLDALARGIDRAIVDLGSGDVETRQGGRRVLDALLSLNELPDDQSGLYAFFLHQIKQGVGEQQIVGKDSSGKTYSTEVWPAVYEPILGVLSVAMEPLQVDLIAKLGDIAVDLKWVRPAINRLTQFLDVIDGRYRLYHATVAEFLTAEKTRDHPGPDTAALYQDAVNQHQQIADHYWQYRDDWSQCDGYGLRNLAAHLDVAGQVERLHQLITEAWMRARVAGEGYRYSGFVSDVMRAWERAHTEVVRQIESNDKDFSAFATCFRYALIKTSINSLFKNYSAELITCALNTLGWSIERLLDMCAGQADAGRRAELYLAVLKTDQTILSDEQRQNIEKEALIAARQSKDAGWALINLIPHLTGTQVGEALATALKIMDPESRADALTALVPHLSGTQKSTVVAEALAAGQQIKNETRQAHTLATLAIQLGGTQIDEALAVAQRIEDGVKHVEVLAAFASQLSGTQRTMIVSKALTATRKIGDDWSKGQALAALAPQLSGTQVGEALDTALEIKDEERRGWALVALAPWLNGMQVHAALDVGRQIEDDEMRAHMLAALATQLSGTQKSTVVGEALDAAQQIDDDRARGPALTALAPQLRGTQVGKALDTARHIGNLWVRAHTLAALAPQLSGTQKDTVIGEALDVAKEIKDEQACVEVLTALAPQLSGTQMDAALAIAGQMGDERRRALAALAPQLSGIQAREALAATRQIKDDGMKVQVLITLVPWLRGTLKTIVVAKALAGARQTQDEKSRGWVLIALAPHLSETQVSEALAAASQIEDDGMKVKVLAALVPRLRGTQKTTVVARAVYTARHIGDWNTRAEALAALAGPLSGSQQVTVVSEALAAVQRTTEDRVRGMVLAALAPLLSETQVGTAMAASQQIEDGWRWIMARVDLAPHLSGTQKTTVVGETLNLALKIESEVWQGSALAALAPHLSETQVSEALAAAGQIEDHASRARVLIALASRCSRARRTKMLDDALDAAGEIKDDWSRARMLITLALQCSTAQETKVLDDALAAARAIADKSHRLGILLALPAPHQDANFLQEMRRCLLDCMKRKLEDTTRAELLNAILTEAIVRSRLLGAETVGMIAQHIVEISERWRWV